VIIDVHAHIAHPDLLARYPMPPSLGDVDGMIEAKAAAGIDLSIVGSPTGAATMVPVPGVDTYRQPADQLRAFHDWLAGTVAERREHLRAYAWCNAFADDRQLAEAADTVRAGGFVGIMANTSVQGEYLDSPRADGFFAMAEELGVPVMLHPGSDPAACQGVKDYGLVEMAGRYCDVTMGLAAIVLSGRLERHPGVRILGASGGGALALLARRLDLAWQPRHWDAGPAAPAGPARPAKAGPPGLRPAARSTVRPSELVRQLYVDTTADGWTPVAMDIDVFGADHVLFGTDSPPLPVNFPAAVESLHRLDDQQRDAVLSGNAAHLFELTPARAT
jgi:aminocarboxymuconate-semialdehyde decarboxylase